MDLIALLRRASEFHERQLVTITADEWALPSNCDGWTVKDLADHVLGGNRFAVGMLAGLDAGAAFADALALGFDDDPVAAYRASVAAQLAAFEAPDALTVLVHHPAGDIGAREFLGFRLGDLLLHAWDLAQSTGRECTLDEELVPVVWEAYRPILGAANDRGVFGTGASGDVSSEAPLPLRLLDLTGRRP